MIDLLREMIHELQKRVAALEARLPPPAPAEASDAQSEGRDTIQPDDPTADDEAA